jgi:hypothetical protein
MALGGAVGLGASFIQSPKILRRGLILFLPATAARTTKTCTGLHHNAINGPATSASRACFLPDCQFYFDK